MSNLHDDDRDLPVASAVLPASYDVESNEEAKDLFAKKQEKEPPQGYQYQPAFQPPVDTRSQSYWGRFNDPQVAALPVSTEEPSDDSPVVVATLDDRQIRHAFIRKVYLILTAQMALTFATCAVMGLNASTRTFVLGDGFWLYYVNMVAVFGLICALSVYKNQYPTNYILLGIFTLSMAYIVGLVTSMYAEAGAGELVVEAVFITATVFLVLSIFTLQTRWDFSFLGAGLGVCLWIMILWGFFGLIFGLQTGYVYALLGSIVFSLFIIYDTYMIAERLDPEDYVIAAIELYLDIVNLFLYILRLLGESDR